MKTISNFHKLVLLRAALMKTDRWRQCFMKLLTWVQNDLNIWDWYLLWAIWNIFRNIWNSKDHGNWQPIMLGICYILQYIIGKYYSPLLDTISWFCFITFPLKEICIFNDLIWLCKYFFILIDNIFKVSNNYYVTDYNCNSVFHCISKLVNA